jgi:DNA repair protein RecN (Recombination protein N)
MLALKGILAEHGRVSVLVFDEIDANIGGRLGSVIGKKFQAMCGRQQVLCITHLPQIAAFAERHLTVRKATEGDRTLTTVRQVQGEERISELAEMIGGTRITETTRAQAREMLETARGSASPVAPVRPAANAAGVIRQAEVISPPPTPTSRRRR